jgi:hypothetical protein
VTGSCVVQKTGRRSKSVSATFTVCGVFGQNPEGTYARINKHVTTISRLSQKLAFHLLPNLSFP